MSESSASSSLPWVEKYRPFTLEDVIAHEHIITTISKLIDEGRLPHLLLYGPPGTGKTSTILACARRMYGKNYSSMILELNASDERGIDVVKERIKEFASSRKIFSTGTKLVILDEADAMTNAAQAALRRVIEKFTKHTRFCLICNYVSKITPALQSRCTRFRFAPIPSDKVAVMLEKVVAAENLDITKGGREAVLRLSNGDMRMCLNVMQATNMAYGKITEENVYLCTGNPTPSDIKLLYNTMTTDSFKQAIDYVKEQQTLKGLALQDMIKEIHLIILEDLNRLDAGTRATLLSTLATIEYRLSKSTSDEMQLGALVGCLQQMKMSQNQMDIDD